MIIPDQSIITLIEKLHASAGKLVLVTTGAGMMAQSSLFSVAGASQTMLETRVPYAETAFRQFIGREPRKYVSAISGRLLAIHALKLAKQLAPNTDEPLIGVACTAAITTQQPKKGDHHAVVAVCSDNGVTCYHLKLNKGLRSRVEEEDVVSRLILYAIFEKLGITNLTAAQTWLGLDPDDRLVQEKYSWRNSFDLLLNDSVNFVGIFDDGRIKTKNINPQLLFPGSFNPFHHGHQALAQIASEMTQMPVAFEISAYNVDKPPLSVDTLLYRCGQFVGNHPIYITNAPTFIDKVRLFPNTTFVVGYDTAARILAPRYYNNDPDEMMAALHEIKELGGRFLVAGRINDDDVFQTAEQLNPPDSLKELFISIPEDKFRQDISSTMIRAQMHSSR